MPWNVVAALNGNGIQHCYIIHVPPTAFIQAFGMLPQDSVKDILDYIKALLLRSTLRSKVLKLTAPIIDQWLDSCPGAITLQSTYVPDVACVLQLIDRLPHHPDVQVLHLPRVDGDMDSADIARILQALHMVLPAMPKLRVLGLSSLTLEPNHMPEVASILSVVRHRLEGFAAEIRADSAQEEG